ncbi:MAG: hypothetical protein QOJ73_1621 [Streptosporangiaceae bacterium]|jgi:hypothetical protein|nr:hypothetical protein [Streptosporangiaceae bacterium]
MDGFAMPALWAVRAVRTGPQWLVPLFEDGGQSAREYITPFNADSCNALLESPDGDSFAHEHGEWVPAETCAQLD